MAHPLTQQPPSSLPFAFAARPSPLSFGFGLPSNASSFSTPLRPSPGTVNWTTPTPALSPSRNSLSRNKAEVFSATPQTSLKRTRRSRSTSSSPSPPPSSPNSSASQFRSEPSSSKVDLSAVAGLALQDSLSTNLSVGPKSVKRSRLDANQLPQTASNDIDVGILLATLSPSAHLPILMELLRLHPSMTTTVLSQIPRLDLKTCIKELNSAIDRFKRAEGPSPPAANSVNVVSTNRRWDRCRDEVEIYCRSASTYIRHFTSSASHTGSFDIQSLFAFLHTVTDHLHFLIRLVPLSAPSSHPVLELAKLALSTWTFWANTLSSEVNQKGGMYPHSIVTQWADSLDQLTMGLVESGGWSSGASQHWSFSSNSVPRPESVPTIYDSSFRQALADVKDHFLAEVGWLIGRSPTY